MAIAWGVRLTVWRGIDADLKAKMQLTCSSLLKTMTR